MCLADFLQLSIGPLEEQFDYGARRSWLAANWYYSVLAAAVYLLLLYGGTAAMAKRPAFQLKPLLLVWNLSLAAFSALGTLRTLPELLSSLRGGGLHGAICDEGGLKSRGPFGFWVWLFCVSKIVELGDSALLVLRKRPLVFIHWYHHASVLIFTWYTNSQPISCGRWYLVMNYAVHTVMYAYYASKTLGVTFPRFIPMTITGLQVTQMLVGFWVTLYAFVRSSADADDLYARGSSGAAVAGGCATAVGNARAGLLLYGSYFVLFFRLFLNSYFSKRRQLASKAAGESRSALSQSAEVLSDSCAKLTNGASKVCLATHCKAAAAVAAASQGIASNGLVSSIVSGNGLHLKSN